MAWVDQTMHHNQFKVVFLEGAILIDDMGHGELGHNVLFDPLSSDDAHAMAFMLRKAAQHLERVGKGLPNE